MLRLLLVAVVIASTGCMKLHRKITGEEDPDHIAVKLEATKFIPDCVGRITVEEKDTGHAMRWLASGCGAYAACRDSERGIQCFENPPRLADFADAWRQRAPKGFEFAAQSVAAQTGCPTAQTRLLRSRQEQFSVILAWNCDRSFECVPVTDSVKRELTIVGAKCDETPESAERTAIKISVDRLALETGCPAKNIQVGEAMNWTRGTERAFRLTACGSAYVCTTAAGRTDCKAALSVQPVPPPAQP